jgi:hypothetical protein
MEHNPSPEEHGEVVNFGIGQKARTSRVSTH